MDQNNKRLNMGFNHHSNSSKGQNNNVNFMVWGHCKTHAFATANNLII
jgi:outer membrane phospholipase A